MAAASRVSACHAGAMAGDELEPIDVERIDDGEEIDDEDIDAEEIEDEVKRLLLRDEAKIASVASLVLIGVGALFALGWVLLAWRIERDDSITQAFGRGDGDPDLVDRIVALVQISGVLLVPLLLVAAGGALRLYSARMLAERDR